METPSGTPSSSDTAPSFYAATLVFSQSSGRCGPVLMYRSASGPFCRSGLVRHNGDVQGEAHRRDPFQPPPSPLCHVPSFWPSPWPLTPALRNGYVRDKTLSDFSQLDFRQLNFGQPAFEEGEGPFGTGRLPGFLNPLAGWRLEGQMLGFVEH